MIMRALLFLPLLLILLAPTQKPTYTTEGEPLLVVSAKWAKSRLTPAQVESTSVPPVAAVISANKIRERNRRAEIPAGMRDPNLDTIDGRSAALEKSVQDSRSAKPADGFVYRVKVHNGSAGRIETVFWEYQFIDATKATPTSRRQFLCAVDIKGDKDKDLEAFSMSGPSDVVSVEAFSKNSGGQFQEKAVVNRVEYTDGSIWQRKGWHLAEVKLGVERAMRKPWGAEMCRGL
jgi:hypothetical protein